MHKTAKPGTSTEDLFTVQLIFLRNFLIAQRVPIRNESLHVLFMGYGCHVLYAYIYLLLSFFQLQAEKYYSHKYLEVGKNEKNSIPSPP